MGFCRFSMGGSTIVRFIPLSRGYLVVVKVGIPTSLTAGIRRRRFSLYDLQESEAFSFPAVIRIA